MDTELGPRILVRLFPRAKKNISDDKKPGDFQRRASDNCGISTFYISNINDEAEKQSIYNNLKPQPIGLFQADAAKLKEAGYQLLESKDGSNHVSVCCSKCNLNDKCCADPCSRTDNEQCPLQNPSVELYTLMNLFRALDDATHRNTNWIEPKPCEYDNSVIV